MTLIIFIKYYNDLKLPENKNNLSDLKRIDTRILRLVVLAISEQGTIRKTPLMEKTRLDYPRLKSYLNWLEMINLVKISDQNITLTENGLNLKTKFSN